MNAFSEIRDELLRLKRDMGYAWVLLKPADKLVLISASLMLLGIRMSWLSDLKGISNGSLTLSDGHLLLAVTAILEVRRAYQCQIEAFDQKGLLTLLPFKLRRVALNYLLIGMLSVIFSTAILIYFANLSMMTNGLDIRLGFYLTTFSGLIILFCGLERFHNQG